MQNSRVVFDTEDGSNRLMFPKSAINLHVLQRLFLYNNGLYHQFLIKRLDYLWGSIVLLLTLIEKEVQ